MEDVTLHELNRRVDSMERREADREQRYVLNVVYHSEMQSLRNDITEIKESQKWAMRFIAGQFVLLVVALLMFLLNRLPL